MKCNSIPIMVLAGDVKGTDYKETHTSLRNKKETCKQQIYGFHKINREFSAFSQKKK